MLFNYIYWKHTVYQECKNFFSRLPIYNREPAIWFTIGFAIPNKVFINNNANKLLLAFVIFSVITLSRVFIPFILLYISFWVMVLESYFFALFSPTYTSNSFEVICA